MFSLFYVIDNIIDILLNINRCRNKIY